MTLILSVRDLYIFLCAARQRRYIQFVWLGAREGRFFLSVSKRIEKGDARARDVIRIIKCMRRETPRTFFCLVWLADDAPLAEEILLTLDYDDDVGDSLVLVRFTACAAVSIMRRWNVLAARSE